MIHDNNVDQKYARFLQRVLVLDVQTASVRLLVESLQSMGAGTIYAERALKAALTVARDHNPQIIFTEFSGPGWDGVEFARTIRRSEFACRMAPIIMITGEATAQAILSARDAGVHEYLRKPYSLNDLARRVEAVTLRSRDWVEGMHYIGPDRRRFNSGEASAPRKRRSSDAQAPSEQGAIEAATRIIRAALDAAEQDPKQAHRALLAQAAELTRIGVKISDAKLTTAASGLSRLLREIQIVGLLDRTAVEAAARPLMDYLPEKPGVA